MRRLLLPLLLSVLVSALAAVLSPSAAWAHTRLVSSTPAQGASAEAPAAVELAFSDPVQAGLSAVSVRDADGDEHVDGTPAAGPDGSSVRAALRAPLEPGTYAVAYRVLAADGHPVTGSFEITATAAAAAPTPSSASSPPASAPTPSTAPTPEPATTAVAQPVAGEPDDGLPVLPLVLGALVAAGAAGLAARRTRDAPPRG